VYTLKIPFLTDFNLPRTSVDVLQKYPGCARCCKITESFRPFHDHSRVRIIEDVFQAKPIQVPIFDPIEIDMIDLCPSLVLIDKGKRRTGNIIDGLDGLSVPQVADQLDRTVHATEALLVRARVAFRRAYEARSRRPDDDWRGSDDDD